MKTFSNIKSMRNYVVIGAVVGFIAFAFLLGLSPYVKPPQPSNDSTDVVRIIHQIWFQGEDQIPARFDSYRKSCRTVNTKWKMLLHDDAALRAACELVDEADPSIKLVELYDSADTMHEKIDIMSSIRK